MKIILRCLSLFIFFSFLQAGFNRLCSQKPRIPFPAFVPIDSLHHANPCATDFFLNAYRKSSAYKTAEEKMNRDILQYSRRADSTDTSIITLPVVFHIVDDNPNAFTNQQVMDAIKDLNDAFSKGGNYAASLGVDTKIRFCLAKKDPDGGITTGITRTVYFFANDLNPLIEDSRLKNLVQWDPSRYINIWYIKNMHLELYSGFYCGNWGRYYAEAYATMPPGGGPTDGIVVSAMGTTLAHEMGHYLSLYHTFEGGNCTNNDCTTDGDKVCDTPPDNSIGNSPACDRPDNSCHTDTLSGFTTDVPDQITNFMDYGNENCHNEFTQGQANRMRAAIATQRPGLLQDECTPPCNENILASFTRDNPYPVMGATVNFTNTSTGAANYQWLVNGTVVDTTPNFTTVFPATGKYKVTLKAYNNDTCYSTFTDYVMVNCGVTARFYTDKRHIAALSPFFIDSIKFTNTSAGATSCQWLMSNDQGMSEQVVSTTKDMTYIFTKPGNYSVRLIAANGTCSDTTLVFTIPVDDPAPDGVVAIPSVECYQQTKISVSYRVCDYGYLPIPAKIPITFYDADPRTAGVNKIRTVYLADSIRGGCCNFYSTILDIGYRGLNTLYAVFNDSGNTKPLVLPNTNFAERSYANNIAMLTGFAFKVSASPTLAVATWGDTIQLKAQARPDTLASYAWSTAKGLSCTNCPSPLLVADSSTTKQVVAISNDGCTDTTTVTIQVPPYNDFTVTVNDVQCARGDSLYVNFTLNNSFKRAVLPKGLSVAFYNSDPKTSGAVLLKPVFSLNDTVFAKQATFTTFINGMNAGNLYAVVNDSAKALPVVFPATTLLEKDYSNNFTLFAYKPQVLKLQPADTTVFRKQSFFLFITDTIYNASSTLWSSSGTNKLSCTACLSPMVAVYQNGTVQTQTENKFGCVLHGNANIKIFPPDMQVKILDTKCYTNQTALVRFSICMNNGYDSVWKNIPVSFYDGDPSSSNTKLLGPVFYTPQIVADSCATFTTIVAAPIGSNQIVSVVNDKGNARAIVPNKQFDETDYANNTDTSSYTPFSVSINPSDTTVDRLSNIQLMPQASGGTIASYLWKPAQYLSCSNCPTPVATPPYTVQFQLIAKNEYNCVDTAFAIIHTHSQDGVFIPNAFTPNGDGKNDVFYIMAGADVTMIKTFAVYNRWGNVIFNVQNVPANSPQFGWNGKVSGKGAPPDVYVYYATVELSNGEVNSYKGTVMLIR